MPARSDQDRAVGGCVVLWLTVGHVSHTLYLQLNIASPRSCNVLGSWTTPAVSPCRRVCRDRVHFGDAGPSIDSPAIAEGLLAIAVSLDSHLVMATCLRIMSEFLTRHHLVLPGAASPHSADRIETPVSYRLFQLHVERPTYLHATCYLLRRHSFLSIVLPLLRRRTHMSFRCG